MVFSQHDANWVQIEVSLYRISNSIHTLSILPQIGNWRSAKIFTDDHNSGSEAYLFILIQAKF